MACFLLAALLMAQVVTLPARSRRRTVAAGRFAIGRFLLLFGVACAALGGVAEVRHVQRLAAGIAPLLDGDLWALPSRVYSRPFEIREGDRMNREAFDARLARLGYASVAGTPARPGEVRAVREGYEIHTRPAETPEGTVSETFARVRLDGASRVASLAGADGRSLGRLVIEPEVLATLRGDDSEDRTVLAYAEFPAALVQAVIAAEDQRFFSHPGVDPIGILRALARNLEEGRIVEGGSTITQQVVKNIYLTPERTWSRKLREAQLALALERRYSKQRILEVYLNEVYLGSRDGVSVSGFAEAAKLYFGKQAQDLSLAESALLAGLVQAPAVTNPFRHPERAVSRRNVVLGAMLEQERIDRASYEAALAEEPVFVSGASSFRSAPHFVQYVRRQLRERYTAHALTSGGLRIHTTLDTQYQLAAHDAVRNGLAKLEKRYRRLGSRAGALEAALLALDPRSGEILAYVGGRDFATNQMDHVALARRQPGSLFKPLVYLAGFERAATEADFSFTGATLLEDSPFELAWDEDVWAPGNYDEEYRGEVTVREALEDSLNVPTVRASQEIGLGAIAAVARRCGLRLESAYPSMALGSEEVTMLEIARAYTVFPGGGSIVEPRAVERVAGDEARPVDRSHTSARRVVSPSSAYLTLDLLRGVVARGTAYAARGAGIHGDYAGKTGTTNDKRDAWFVGFSPELLVGVWVGFDDNAETGLAGASGALPIWTDFVRSIGAASGAGEFIAPDGIVRVAIDPHTGALARIDCPQVVEEPYVLGTEPLEVCADEHRADLFAEAESIP